MGRKTLLQSTKKKSGAKKKDEEEKKKVGTKKTSSSKSKTVAAKGKKTKTAAKPKKAGKKTSTTKAKKTAKATAKAVGSKTKKPALKTLLFKKFDSIMPESPPKSPFVKKAEGKLPEAPPFISADSEEETKRMKTLLFKQFDLYDTSAPKQSPQETDKPATKPTAKEQTPPTKDLLFKKFDSAMPEKPPKSPFAKKAGKKLPEAPPFVSADSEEETKRMKTLLFKQFDLYGHSAPQKPKESVAPPASPETTEGPPPGSPEGSPPVSKGIIWGIGLAAFLIAVLLWASASNTNSFYLKPTDQGIQIWRGKFAPTGSEKVVTIEGMQAPKPIKEVYSKQEIYPLVFDYFRNQADAALAAQQGPDFAKIKQYLRQAMAYAPTEDKRRQVQSRLRDIDFMLLFHRAEVAMAKGTEEGLQRAKEYLNQANTMASSDYQRELVKETRQAISQAGATPTEK